MYRCSLTYITRERTLVCMQLPRSDTNSIRTSAWSIRSVSSGHCTNQISWFVREDLSIVQINLSEGGDWISYSSKIRNSISVRWDWILSAAGILTGGLDCSLNCTEWAETWNEDGENMPVVVNWISAWSDVGSTHSCALPWYGELKSTQERHGPPWRRPEACFIILKRSAWSD